MRGSCRSTPKSAEPDARRRHALADLTASAYLTAAATCGRAGFVAKNMRVDFRLIADMIAPGTAGTGHRGDGVRVENLARAPRVAMRVALRSTWPR